MSWDDRINKYYPAERQAQEETMCRNCEHCEYDLSFHANVTRDIVSETQYGRYIYSEANPGCVPAWIVRTKQMADIAIGFCKKHEMFVDPYAVVDGESFCDGSDFVQSNEFPQRISSVE